MASEQPTGLLTVREAASRLSCGLTNLYALIDEGLLPVVRVGKAKGYRIDVQDIERFIAERKQSKHASGAASLQPHRKLKHLRLK